MSIEIASLETNVTEALPTADLVAALKAAAEPTRLRILLLLSRSELSVKDLTQVLGQSQPRLSRHLKLLTEAGLVERFRDGSWVYFHVSDRTAGGHLARRLISVVEENDAVARRDRERLDALKRDREQAAQAYFKTHAADWDRIRSLYVPEAAVEKAMLRALPAGPFRLFVDLGTGTGRILELFAGRYARGLGFDLNQSMLAYAESKLSAVGRRDAEVRHGDLYDLNLQDRVADAVVMHQVLHYLDDPAAAIAEAARILAPGGKLMIVDFAPHEIEFLREEHAHKRLGIGADAIAQWTAANGLELKRSESLVREGAAPQPALTVSLWVAERPAASHSKTAKRTGETARHTEEAR
jgi:ubiquinone/menaquinone biosynthesis C-methylase UbiE/DNA-binding transcriptional ArsR family regulator